MSMGPGCPRSAAESKVIKSIPLIAVLRKTQMAREFFELAVYLCIVVFAALTAYKFLGESQSRQEAPLSPGGVSQDLLNAFPALQPARIYVNSQLLSCVSSGGSEVTYSQAWSSLQTCILNAVNQGISQRFDSTTGLGSMMIGDHNVVLYMGLSQSMRYIKVRALHSATHPVHFAPVLPRTSTRCTCTAQRTSMAEALWPLCSGLSLHMIRAPPIHSPQVPCPSSEQVGLANEHCFDIEAPNVPGTPFGNSGQYAKKFFPGVVEAGFASAVVNGQEGTYSYTIPLSYGSQVNLTQASPAPSHLGLTDSIDGAPASGPCCSCSIRSPHHPRAIRPTWGRMMTLSTS